MLPRNIMLQPSDQFMLLNRSVQPFPDVMPDRSRLFKMAGIVRFRPFLHDVMTLKEQGIERRPEVHLGFEAAGRLDD
ncbi:hypothetical protein, partial [Escherichia coli]